MKKIMLSTGGTGGHVFPAQAVFERLKHRFEVTIVCDKRGEKFLAQDDASNKLKFGNNITLRFSGFQGSILKKVMSINYLVLDLITLLYLFIKKPPSLVIGFGGYASFPVLFTALVRGVPILLHEQNAVIGRVNKWFLPFCKLLAISFKETIAIPDHYGNKIRYIGNPIRAKFFYRQYVNNDNIGAICITVIGGSQGSSIFSKVIPHAISLLPTALQGKLLVYHQARLEDAKSCLYMFEQTCCKFEIKTFFNNIESLLHKSNLIISRAGASTIAELILYKKPAILVPFARAKDNHQYYNAMDLVKSKSAILIDERDFNPEYLAKVLLSLLTTKKLDDMNSYALQRKDPQASEAMEKYIEEILVSG